LEEAVRRDEEAVARRERERKALKMKLATLEAQLHITPALHLPASCFVRAASGTLHPA